LSADPEAALDGTSLALDPLGQIFCERSIFSPLGAE
jgi:hypothetical protein